MQIPDIRETLSLNVRIHETLTCVKDPYYNFNEGNALNYLKVYCDKRGRAIMEKKMSD